MVQNYCVVKILVLSLAFWATNGFNISPRPNQSFREPKKKVSMAQSQSSYFGFTIILRGSSVIVGAPRAQSTHKLQLKINEPGAIYNCSIASGNCKPLIFDYTGNIKQKQDKSIFSQETKDYQWLGASMDGGSQDADKLVVCAPRLTATTANDSLMHGICYWKQDTLRNDPLDSKKITPLRLVSNQVIETHNMRKRRFIHMFGEQGLSVHVTSNNEEIIIGAPGINNWRGSVIRFRKNQKNIYTAVIPSSWKQHDDSYLGYSVGSGYFDSAFPNKTYYVASAPQADRQSGEVYIFDIVKTSSGEYESTNTVVFRGTQFGEYFGYAVLAEDFNGDGLTDLIITAPQYSSDDIVEQGAMYVFINKGRFVFNLQKIIKSPFKGTGRFGSAISKLGDINRDGFNDIAVGAPFAGNGTVFIYLGCSKGLREVSSQNLSVGPITNSWGSSSMFGHGLSKGLDIDKNGFNDLAIGAPNSESVFLYRAYPVVKIHATINSLSRQIKLDQKKFQIRICFRISTTSQKVQSQDIAIRVNVDPRVTLLQTNSDKLTFIEEAGEQDQCHLLDAKIRFNVADIFKPIELKMHYDIINGVPNSEEFCNKCVAIDPADPKACHDKIIFTTGCKTDICIAHLRVTSFGLSQTYILGRNKTISVTYVVTNSGETAYLPQINITSSNNIPFNKIPPSCNQHEDVLLCDLNRRQSMLKNNKETINIVYDVSQIEGPSIINLTASVFCAGSELNSSVSDIIALVEFTEIEVNGKTNTTNIDLAKVFNSTEIIDMYEVKSSGPSKIKELEIAFEIPIAHKFNGSTHPVFVIDFNNITVQGIYNSQLLNVELLNSSEIDTQTIIQTGKQAIFQPSNKSIELGKVSEEADKNITRQMAPNESYIKAAQNKLNELLSKEQLESLRTTRTIAFSCIDPETITCLRAVIKVNNLIPDTAVNVTLKYNVDLNKVNEVLIEPWEFFVIIPKVNIVKLGYLDGNSINITKNMEFNVIFKNHLYNNDRPWLLIIVSAILGGLPILATISYGMYKFGFFRRTTKEEMIKLVQEKEETAQWREEMKKLFPKREVAENADGKG